MRIVALAVTMDTAMDTDMDMDVAIAVTEGVQVAIMLVAIPATLAVQLLADNATHMSVAAISDGFHATGLLAENMFQDIGFVSIDKKITL